MKKPMTAAEGANQERKAWMSKLKRVWREWQEDGSDHARGVLAAISVMQTFGEGRTKRFNKKAGGLGKK
jgi:hypothetical protein